MKRPTPLKAKVGVSTPQATPNKAKVKGLLSKKWNPPGTADSTRGVRVIENGVDLTPLPLVATAPTKSVEVRSMIEEVPIEEKEEEIVKEPEEMWEEEEKKEESREIIQMLSESKTITLLEIFGSCVATDFSRKKEIEARNEAYFEKLNQRKENADRFASRHAQTIQRIRKDVAVTAKPPVKKDIGCQSTNWDIFDATGSASSVAARGSTQQVEETQTVSTESKWKDHLDTEIHKAVGSAFAAPDFLLDVSEANVAKENGDPDDVATAGSWSGPTPNFRSLAGALARVERCVQQNVFHDKQLRYRNRLSAEQVADAAEKAYDAALEDDKDDDDDDLPPTLDDAASSGETTTKEETKEDDATAATPGNAATTNKEAADTKSTSSATAAEATTNPAETTPTPPETTTTTKDSPPRDPSSLEELWSWNAPMTRGRSVTSMSWNRCNDDVLAVGYGDFGHDAASSGLVLFWSLRNPVYPELSLSFETGCTAVDFSTKTPNLLAVGFRDGTVAIFNVRTVGTTADEDRTTQQPIATTTTAATGTTAGGLAATPVLDSSQAPGKHMDPVWQVRWVDKGSERGEALVSISTDGRVVEWSMKKGFEETTLMVLKRVGNSDGVISRQASGLCFDFTIDDPSIYLAATEDGLLHRCSSSYNEQYLETYTGHTGPVYKIKCNPFWAPAFLSCSADWTVNLWHQQKQAPVLSFHAVDLADVVYDVAWAPHKSTIFASVAGDGRIELWDLAVSTLDPVIRSYTKRHTFMNPFSSEVPPAPPGDDDDPEDRSLGGVLDSSRNTPPAPPRADPALTDDDLPAPGSTAVLFATSAPVLVVGDSHGAVTCYRIHGLGLEALPAGSQRANLKAAMFPEAKV